MGGTGEGRDQVRLGGRLSISDWMLGLLDGAAAVVIDVSLAGSVYQAE